MENFDTVDALIADVSEIIAEEAGLDPSEVRPETALMSSGLLDSFALVTVLTMIEEHLGGPLEPEHLTMENFDSLGKMSQFLRLNFA